MAKDKKEKKEKKAAKETPKAEVAEVPVSSPAKEEKEVDRYEERLKAISPIAQPLANKKLTKKIYKVVKKGWLYYYSRRNLEFSSNLSIYF